MNWKTYIENLLQLGWTKRRIAREVGVSETIIYRLLNDNAVDMRHRNGERLKALHDEAVNNGRP